MDLRVPTTDPLPPSQIAEHIRFWMGKVNDLGLPQVEPEHKHTVSISFVAGARSIERFKDRIAREAGMASVWGINSGYAWLLKNGIVPRATMILDPLPAMLEHLTEIRDDTVFYVASTAHPRLWERLAGKDVRIFHAISGANYAAGPGIKHHIIGGSSTATRAPHLAYLLGYRQMNVYGVDSSFAPEATTHLTQDTRWYAPPIRVRCNGAEFHTQWDLLAQAEYWRALLEADQGDVALQIHAPADTLIAAMLSGDGTYEVIPETAVEAA